MLQGGPILKCDYFLPNDGFLFFFYFYFFVTKIVKVFETVEMVN